MKNSLVIGFLLGLISPIIAYLLQHYTDLQMRLFPDKPIGFFVIAAGLNLVGCWIAYKKGYDKIGNGLVLITFLGMLLMVITKQISI